MATDTSNPLFPDDILFYIAEQLDKPTLLGLRSVSKAFLDAATLRRDSDILLSWPRNWIQQATLERCMNPDVAQRIRRLEVDLPNGIDNLRPLLDLFTLATNVKTLFIITNDIRWIRPMDVPSGSWVGKFEQVTHFHLEAERLSDFRLEEITLPNLTRFTFTNEYRDHSREDPVPSDDVRLADFIQRHGAKLRALSIRFQRAFDQSFFKFNGELPNLIELDIVGSWTKTLAQGRSVLPFQSVIDRRAGHLKELCAARSPPGDFSNGEWEYLEEMFKRTSILSCPPAFTKVKLGLPFNITPVFWAWFASLLPQLTVFWLSQNKLDTNKLIELVDRLETTPPLEDLMLFSDDQLGECCETLARLFPRIDNLRFIIESAGLPDPSRSMVLEYEPRFQQLYRKHAVKRNPKWAVTEFAIQQYIVDGMSSRLEVYVYAGRSRQGVDLKAVGSYEWPNGFY